MLPPMRSLIVYACVSLLVRDGEVPPILPGMRGRTLGAGCPGQARRTGEYGKGETPFCPCHLGPNPTFVSPRAIRGKNRQMKELSDDLLHIRSAQKPCIWL